MENKNNVKVITFRDLWDIFVSRLWVLAVAAVVAVAILFTVSTLTFVPQYESVATLYILKQNENTDSSTGNSEDFSLALKVVNDCNYLLKGHSVLDEVIKEQDLKYSYKQLYDRVTVTNPTDTRILEVRVEADSPELAKQIVDSICVIGTEKIEQAMGFQQVNLYEYGILKNEPCNNLSLTAYFLAAIAAAALTYVVFLLIFIFDDRIRTNEEIENAFGLSILGEIPNVGTNGKKGKYSRYYRGYGNKYGYGYGYGYGHTPHVTKKETDTVATEESTTISEEDKK